MISFANMTGRFLWMPTTKCCSKCPTGWIACFTTQQSRFVCLGHAIVRNALSRIRLELFRASPSRETHLVGEYNFDNALAAVAIGKYFGINADSISDALEAYQPKITVRSSNAPSTTISSWMPTMPILPAWWLQWIFLWKSLRRCPKLSLLAKWASWATSVWRSIKSWWILLLRNNSKKFIWWATIFKTLTDGDESLRRWMNGNCFSSVAEIVWWAAKKSAQGYYILLKGSHSVHLEKAVPFL